MKKILLSALVLVVGLVLGGLGTSLVQAGGRIDTSDIYYCDTIATTSVVTLGIESLANTSECIIPVAGLEKISIDTQVNASTTASVVLFKFYVSQDKADWFDLPNVTVDSSITNTVGSTTAAFSYTPGAPGFSRTSFQINPDHKYIKVVRSATTATSSVWTQVALTRGY
jgi:hypothetical protein